MCTYRYSYSYAVTGDSGESPAHRHSLLAVAADGSVIRGGDSDSERRRRPHRRFASVNAKVATGRSHSSSVTSGSEARTVTTLEGLGGGTTYQR